METGDLEPAIARGRGCRLDAMLTWRSLSLDDSTGSVFAFSQHRGLRVAWSADLAARRIARARHRPLCECGPGRLHPRRQQLPGQRAGASAGEGHDREHGWTDAEP